MGRGIQPAYQALMKSKAISFGLHALAAILAFVFPWTSLRNAVTTPRPPSVPLVLHFNPSKKSASPGQGGAQTPAPPRRGKLPLLARYEWIPPLPNVRETEPILVLEPALAVQQPVDVKTANLLQVGDPLGKPEYPGLGRGGHGIGMDGDGSYGDKPGAGGAGYKGLPRGNITDAVVLYKPEPEFSEEARKAKIQGTVVLETQIGADGKVHVIRIASGLGLGLDEKAAEAVARWRFKPATRDGKPVTSPATVFVNFRLL